MRAGAGLGLKSDPGAARRRVPPGSERGEGEAVVREMGRERRWAGEAGARKEKGSREKRE